MARCLAIHGRPGALALLVAVVGGGVACSDVLGLDDLSVGAADSSVGTGGAGGAMAGCTDCSLAACGSVFGSCSADSPAGCSGFLSCIESRDCSDQACASGCLADHPAGQTVVDCICSSCASDCGMYCGGLGGAGATGGAGGGT